MPTQLTCPYCGTCVDIIHHAVPLVKKVYWCPKCKKEIPEKELRKSFMFGSR